MSGERTLVLLANNWGPKQGGINAFNTDFAKALGQTLGPGRVVCVVLEMEASEETEAAASNVRLLALGKGREKFDELYAEAVLSLLRDKGTPVDVSTIWIGHDVHTGPVALRLAEISKEGRSVVIQHMSYGDYIAFRDGSGEKAQHKQQSQEELYRGADMVFAVGPLLRGRLAEILYGQDKIAYMIVPGLANITPNDAPRSVFRAVAMGRLGPGDDRIKQGRLALAAFASAIGKAHEDPAWPEILKQGEMLLYGIEQSGSEEEAQLHKLAEEAAQRGVNLKPLKFTHDREQLFKDLALCDAAMMLSWHEGFGLTGWEAIAAEVPLIASENSGLHLLIKESLGDAGLALFQHLNIRGSSTSGDGKNYRPEDEEAVRLALLMLAKDPQKAKANAKRLKNMLLAEGYNWTNAALEFLKNLGVKKRQDGVVKMSQGGTVIGTGQTASMASSYSTKPKQEDEQTRSRKLLAQLGKLFESAELQAITESFVEYLKANRPSLNIDRLNLADYLLSEKDERLRYENVARFFGLVIGRRGDIPCIPPLHKLSGLLLQTLVRKCSGSEDRGFSRLPFENPQTAELVAATRTSSPHLPAYSAESLDFFNGKRDKYWGYIGTYIPTDGKFTIEEYCQSIAANLLVAWFDYSPKALPSDPMERLEGLLEPCRYIDPGEIPIHGLYVKKEDTLNSLNVPEIAAKLHETLGDLLWVYQYGKQHEPDSDSDWLYTTESKIEGWIREYESSVTGTPRQPLNRPTEQEQKMGEKKINVGDIGNGATVNIFNGEQSSSAIGKGNIVINASQAEHLQSLLDHLKSDAGRSPAVDKLAYAEIAQVTQQVSQELVKPQSGSKTVLQNAIRVLGRFRDLADIAESIDKVTSLLLTLIG